MSRSFRVVAAGITVLIAGSDDAAIGGDDRVCL